MNQIDEARRHVLPDSSRQDQRIRRNTSPLCKLTHYLQLT